MDGHVSLDGIEPVGHSNSYATTTMHNLGGFEILDEPHPVDSALKARKVFSAADNRGWFFHLRAQPAANIAHLEGAGIARRLPSMTRAMTDGRAPFCREAP